MGMVSKRKKMHYGDTHLQRRWRVRNRKRDLDQIDKDIETGGEKLINQEVDLEKPGFAQFYCVHCAKYFIEDKAMQAHFKTKVHKRRLKALEVEPYSIEEAERAAGQGSYVKPKTRTMTTQPTKEEVKAGKRLVLEEKPQTPAKKRRSEKMQVESEEKPETPSKKRKTEKMQE